MSKQNDKSGDVKIFEETGRAKKDSSNPMGYAQDRRAKIAISVNMNQAKLVTTIQKTEEKNGINP